MLIMSFHFVMSHSNGVGMNLTSTYLPLPFMYRYAYSEEVGEESDDEEARSLTKGKHEDHGELSLVRQEKNGGTDGSFDGDDESEEDKRE